MFGVLLNSDNIVVMKYNENIPNTCVMVEGDFEDCVCGLSYVENNKLISNKENYDKFQNQISISVNNKTIYEEYIKWFDTYFAMQLQQHSWQSDYSPSYDEYFKCNYKSWDALCVKAQSVREKINELKELLK